MDTGSVAIDTAVVRISVDVLAGKITGDFSSISFQRNERFMVVMKSSLSPLIISSESNVRKSKVLKLN